MNETEETLVSTSQTLQERVAANEQRHSEMMQQASAELARNYSERQVGHRLSLI